MSRPIGVLSSLERVLFESAEIQKRVADLAKEIENDYAGQELSVLALMDGSLFFVADVLRSLDLPIRLHTLSISSYHGSTHSSGRIRMPQTLPEDLKGRHVLLIDDILDTGLTLASVQDRLEAEAHVKSLRTAVLLRKDRVRAMEPTVDYVGFDIPDEFVVGYGMDYEGHYRNLSCIGILNPTALLHP